MKKTKEEIKNWEEEFDKFPQTKMTTKEFIRKLLTQQKQEMVKIVEQVKEVNESNGRFNACNEIDEFDNTGLHILGNRKENRPANDKEMIQFFAQQKQGIVEDMVEDMVEGIKDWEKFQYLNTEEIQMIDKIIKLININ